MEKCEEVSFDQLPLHMQSKVIEFYGPIETHDGQGVKFFRYLGTGDYAVVTPAPLN